MIEQRIVPREHCGDQMPSWVAGPRSECTLKPGHSGSHADDKGARWWYDAEDTDWRQRALQAEAAIDRVRAALVRIGRMKASIVDGIYCLDVIEEALDPPAHNAGPTIAECAHNDRRWPLEKEGE